jgi:hypothetical protein
VTGIGVLVDGSWSASALLPGPRKVCCSSSRRRSSCYTFGLTVAVALGRASASKARVMLATAGVTLMLPAGAVVGMLRFQGMSKALLTGLFAFELVACSAS